MFTQGKKKRFALSKRIWLKRTVGIFFQLLCEKFPLQNINFYEILALSSISRIYFGNPTSQYVSELMHVQGKGIFGLLNRKSNSFYFVVNFILNFKNLNYKNADCGLYMHYVHDLLNKSFSKH